MSGWAPAQWDTAARQDKQVPRTSFTISTESTREPRLRNQTMTGDRGQGLSLAFLPFFPDATNQPSLGGGPGVRLPGKHGAPLQVSDMPRLPSQQTAWRSGPRYCCRCLWGVTGANLAAHGRHAALTPRGHPKVSVLHPTTHREGGCSPGLRSGREDSPAISGWGASKARCEHSWVSGCACG